MSVLPVKKRPVSPLCARIPARKVISGSAMCPSAAGRFANRGLRGDYIIRRSHTRSHGSQMSVARRSNIGQMGGK